MQIFKKPRGNVLSDSQMPPLTHMEYATVLKRDQKLFHVFDLASKTNYREIQCKSKACFDHICKPMTLAFYCWLWITNEFEKKTISTQNAIIDFKVLIFIQMLLNGFMRTQSSVKTIKSFQRWQSLPYYLMKRFWTGCAINSKLFHILSTNVNLIKC